MLFYLETNSKSGKIYLIATMKYTRCAYLSPPLTGINHYNLQKKPDITLLPCLFMILLAFSIITLIMLYHILARFEFQFIYLLYLIILKMSGQFVQSGYSPPWAKLRVTSDLSFDWELVNRLPKIQTEAEFSELMSEHFVGFPPSGGTRNYAHGGKGPFRTSD